MIKLRGRVRIPGSKSHTIRGLLLAALAEAEGQSSLIAPLISEDTLSAKRMIEQFGAKIEEVQSPEQSPDEAAACIWRIKGISQSQGKGKDKQENKPIDIDVGNSGTALYLGTAVAALLDCPVHFDGDHSIRSRSAKNLLLALQDLGVKIQVHEGDAQKNEQGFCCPYTVQGPLTGGVTRLSAPTSQYLSALLLALPLMPSGCEAEINLELLNEHPYVDMTLDWLQEQGIRWKNRGYEQYTIAGGQKYHAFEKHIPADFSSATFFLCAAAITASTIQLAGLNPNDVQGDKKTLDFLAEMGCCYRWLEGSGFDSGNPILEFSGPQRLKAVELDLSQTPDALPAIAVACACAEDQSCIFNVAHARNKETDRIACMARELQELGFAVEEKPDGLLIWGGPDKFLQAPRRRSARGYADHRIIMALSLLNLLEPQVPLEIDDSSYAAVTFPSFFDDLQQLSQS